MRHFWFPLFWALCILFLCTIGTENLPSIGFLNLFSFDKFVHALMFGVLALTLIVAFRRQGRISLFNKRAILFATLGSVLYGTAVEILQYLMSTGRSAEWQDILANTVGCVLGVYFFRLVYGKQLFRAS
ncbi:MAG: VanZ family protein [Parvicellaceae bacterium]|jgi:VanZ family protein